MVVNRSLPLAGCAAAGDRAARLAAVADLYAALAGSLATVDNAAGCFRDPAYLSHADAILSVVRRAQGPPAPCPPFPPCRTLPLLALSCPSSGLLRSPRSPQYIFSRPSALKRLFQVGTLEG